MERTVKLAERHRKLLETTPAVTPEEADAAARTLRRAALRRMRKRLRRRGRSAVREVGA